MTRTIAFIAVVFWAAPACAAERVAYVNRDVVECYVGDDGTQKFRTVVKSVAITVSDFQPVYVRRPAVFYFTPPR